MNLLDLIITTNIEDLAILALWSFIVIVAITTAVNEIVKWIFEIIKGKIYENDTTPEMVFRK